MTVAEGTGTGTGSAATPNMAWNAARLQTGMTEVLVAPGLRTPQEEAKPDPATTGTPEQAKASLEGYDAEGTLGDDTDSQALELHLDTNSEAGAVAGMVDLPLSSEAEEERATPVMGLVDDGGYPVEEEGVGGEDAGLQEADLDVQSMVSDGADSYQGLPAETSAHLAASAHDSMSGVGEDAEREVTIEGQVDALDAARQGQEVEEQQSPQEALEPGTEQEINLAAQSDALDAACEEHMEGEGAQSPQEAFQPSIEVSTARQSDDQDAAAHKAGMQIEAQQAPQKALESGTAAQTELHGEAGQEISMPEGQQLQLDDAVTEPGDQSELQMDVDSSLPEAAEASADSPVQDLTGFEAVGWDKGKVVEVHCSAADVPEVWAWRVGALGNPHLPGGPNPAIVQWRSNPSATLFSSELVEAARLRPAAPLETYIAQTDMPARGSILEVECNEGRGFKCAVLVCRQSPSLGGERDLHSIVHTRSAGTVVLHSDTTGFGT